MPYKQLTKLGEDFINEVCRINGQTALTGYDKPLLNGNPSTPQGGKWVANLPIYKINGTSTAITSSNLGELLIKLFNYYSKEYDLDANIIAAQAYAESRYILWAHSNDAMGLTQFTMPTIYSVVVRNQFIGSVGSKFTATEISDITDNFEYYSSETSYQVYKGTDDNKNIAMRNKARLFQNLMNRPDLMIKAQCNYMRYIADNSGKLASTTLFCYNRGIKFMNNTYSKAIEGAKNYKKTENYEQEGLNYVLRIFGILSDKNNTLSIPGIGNKYKPKKYSFGYDLNVNEYPNKNFSAYDANVSESDEFNIPNNDFNDLKGLNNLPNYSFIYFPETQYHRISTKKNQAVLHHTVSGPSVAGDVYYWESKGDKVATAFLVDREGKIHQTFSTDYYAAHIGITGSQNDILHKSSIGIEIDSWGGLTKVDNKWYPSGNKTNEIPIQNVIEYPNGYRGFYAFEKYTNEQIAAVRQLIVEINKKWPDIELKYNEDMWDVSQNAINGKNGIWTHTSYRSDKSDCHPQPELIQMLQSLK
jgi:hypothetical protein